MKILAEKNGFLLTKNGDFFQFGSKKDFSSFCGVPVRQCGTLEEVKNELMRWKDEIDFNNPKMLEVENSFISALETI